MILRPVFLAVALLSGQAFAMEPVALVYKLEGDVSLVSGEDTSQSAALYDWLHVGDEIRPAKGGRAEIAFVDGKRYALVGPAAAKVAAEGLLPVEGNVETLPGLPPMPRLAETPHEKNAFATTRLGGVVLRGAGLAWIYPREGATTIARHTTLRFGAGADAPSGFRVVLEDEDGAVLLHTVVKEPQVEVPPDLLAEGRRYFWRVLAIGETGTSGTAEGEFLTLDSVRSTDRDHFQGSMESTQDPYVIALGAEADRSLGLLWEARDGFCRAHRLFASDAALELRCEELDAKLGK